VKYRFSEKLGQYPYGWCAIKIDSPLVVVSVCRSTLDKARFHRQHYKRMPGQLARL
jgi:hypothetical protein